jgi:hypothetical protein
MNMSTSTRYQALKGIITLTEQIIVNTFAGILDYVTGQRQLQHRVSRSGEQQSRRSQSFTVLLEKLTVPRPVKKPPAFYEARISFKVFKSSPPLFPVLSQINPVFALLTDLRIN